MKPEPQHFGGVGEANRCSVGSNSCSDGSYSGSDDSDADVQQMIIKKATIQQFLLFPFK
jgi:hypothetical protein